MQDQYVGDIGDFGKYGLLRFLLDGSDLKLGVNWYFVTNESKTKDGRRIEYLLDECENKKNSNLYKDCDPPLYQAMYNIVNPELENGKVVSKGNRCVHEIEKSKILPEKTIFYHEKLSADNRETWFSDSYDKLKDCDIIFFDPDNGIPYYDRNAPRVSKHSSKSVKYTYYDEIDKYYEKGKKTVIVYQHKDMKKDKNYLGKLNKIRNNVEGVETTFRMRWHRYIARDYVIILSPKHCKTIEGRLKVMKQRKWCRLDLFKPQFAKVLKNPHFTIHYDI